MNRSLHRTNLSTLFEFIYSIIKVLIGVFYKPRTTKELYGHRKFGYLKPILKSSVYFFIFVAWASLTKVSAQTCSVNAGVSITYCPGQLMTLFGNATGDAQQNTVLWTQLSGPAVTIINPNALQTNCGIAQDGQTYQFQIRVVCGDNNTVTNTVTYSVVSNTAINAGNDQSLSCKQFNQSFSINVPNLPSGTTIKSKTFTGSAVSSSSSVSIASPTTINFNLFQNNTLDDCINGSDVTVTIIFEKINPNNCPASYDTLRVNFPVYKNNPITFDTIKECNNKNILLRANACFASAGTSTWSLVNAPAGYSFSPITGDHAILLTNLPVGTYVFNFAITGSPCFNFSQNVTFTMSNIDNCCLILPQSDANYYDKSYSYCGQWPTNITLNAKPLNPGETGLWTSSPSGLIFSNTTSVNSTVSGFNSSLASYSIIWTVTNSCGIQSSSFKILKFSDTYHTFTSSCAGSNLTYASCPGEVFSTTGQISGEYVYLLEVNETVFIDGIVWTSTPSNSGFPEGNQLSFDPLSRTVSNYCNKFYAEYNNLGYYLNYMTISINRDAPPGIYSGYIQYTSASGCTYKRYFTFSHKMSSSSSNAGTDQILPCNDTQTNLAANDPLLTPPYFGEGKWTLISGPNSPTIANIYDKGTFVSGMTAGLYTFEWKIYGGEGCTSDTDTMTVSVSKAINFSITAGSDITTCANSIHTLSANTVPSGSLNASLTNTGAVGFWTQISGPAVTLNSPNLISTTTSPLPANSVFKFVYTISNICGTYRDTISITTNSTLAPSLAQAGNDQCLGNNTSATLTANTPTNGTGLWTEYPSSQNGSIVTPSSPNSNVTGLSPGGLFGYIWTVSSASCPISTTRDTVYISNVGASSTLTAGIDQTICSSNVNRIVALSASALPPGYTGTWNKISGGFVSFANINSPSTNVTLLADGDYTFAWTANNFACPSISDQVTIRYYKAPSVANILSADITLSSCTSNALNISATTPVSGNGTWYFSQGTGTISSPNSAVTGMNFNEGLNIVKYEVSTNNSFCPNTVDSIRVFSIAALAKGLDQTVTCANQYAVLQASGGVSYLWSNGSTNSTIAVNPIVITNYTVQVTNAYGCTDTEVVTVTPIGYPGNIVLTNKTICYGQSTSIVASGGGTYFWSNDMGTNKTVVVSPTTTQTYTVTVTTPTGCTTTAEVVVHVNALPSASAGLDKTLMCNPASVTLNGSGGVSYLWGPTGLNTTFSQSQNYTTSNWHISYYDAYGRIVSLYTLTVTDANGCKSTDQVSVLNYRNEPLISQAFSVSLNCSNPGFNWSASSSVPNAEIVLYNPESNTWVNFGTSVFIPDELEDWGFLIGTGNNIFELNLTDPANGCYAETLLTINVNYSVPLASAGPDKTLTCSAPNATLVASGGGTYFWSHGLGTNATVVVSPASNTTYSVTVTGSNGCKSTDNVVVKLGSSTSVSAGLDKTTTCTASNATLVASSLYSGLTYSWSHGLGTNATVVVNPAVNTTYTVTVTATATGCTNTDQVVVSVNESLPIVNLGPNVTYCRNLSSYTINGTTSGVSSYIWSTGQNTASITVNPSASDTFTVTVTSSNGCGTTSDNVVVSKSEIPNITLLGTEISLSCSNPSSNMSVTGNLPGQYYWGDQDIYGSVLPISINDVSGNNYPPDYRFYTYLYYTDLVGCETEFEFTYNINKTLPTANAGLDVTLSCAVTSTAMTATGGENYLWSTGQNTSTITVNPTATTTYTVTVTGTNGCKSSDQIILTKNPCTYLGGTVWIDNNLDGLQNGETTNAGLNDSSANSTNGVNNVQVVLYSASSNLSIASTITNTLGDYQFLNLDPGSYYVKFIVSSLPSGYQITTFDADGSGNGLSDSDASISGVTAPVTIGSSIVNFSLDLGIYQVLPIRLKYFSGSSKDCKVNLKWATSTEKDNAGFEIERSLDGINFSMIKTIPGVGNSVEDQHYTTTDATTQNAYYYRLVQVDIDGTRNISSTIYVKTDCAVFNSEGINALYPNPVNGSQKMTLKYTSNNNESGKLAVMDVHGKVVLQKDVELTDGLNSFYFDVDNLVNGIYFVKIESDKGQANKFRKFVKVD